MSALPPKADILQCGKRDPYLITSSDLTTCSKPVRRAESSSRLVDTARRLEINLSHGVAWKALISRYITVIPLIGDELCIAMQSMSGWPLKKPVHKAMIANVGAAAGPSHRAMPGAALPPPAQVSTS